MTARRIDTEIDRLYQLPPDEFTAARNALAKSAGADRAEVRDLAKPPIAAWAVNQIYWKQREVYDALIEASTELRKVHKAILAGRTADIREAGKVHEGAIDAALKTAMAILRDAGHPASDSTRQAIMTTLRALPGDDPPGRLTRTLQPGGFEMLAGLSLGAKAGSSVVRLKPEAAKAEAASPAAAKAARTKSPAATPRGRGGDSAQQDVKPRIGSAKIDAAERRQAARAEAAQARAARDAAVRAVREAEQSVRREQFEAARLTREAIKADKQAEAAREAFESAQQAVSEAQANAARAAVERDAALERSRERERELRTARDAARKA